MFVFVRGQLVAKNKGMHNFLDCSLCFRQLRDPRLLDCGHTFCMECLRKHFCDTCINSNDQISCPNPSCKTKTKIPIPPGGIDSLKKNHFVNNVLVAANFFEMMECKECLPDNSFNQHDNVEYFCFTCKSLMCARCKKRHAINDNHVIISKEELKDSAKKLNYTLDEQDGTHKLIPDKNFPVIHAISAELKFHHYEAEIMKTRKSIDKFVHEQKEKVRQHCEQLLQNLDNSRKSAIGGVIQNTQSEIESLRQFQENVDKLPEIISQNKELYETAVHSSANSLRSDFIGEIPQITGVDPMENKQVFCYREINVAQKLLVGCVT